LFARENSAVVTDVSGAVRGPAGRVNYVEFGPGLPASGGGGFVRWGTAPPYGCGWSAGFAGIRPRRLRSVGHGPTLRL